MIFCVENNQFGMGTSTARHSSNNEYYTMGNKIPGILMDGMNVFAVREAMALVKDYCATGNGPMYVEMNTYRYHGHSMSDPGTTYRTKDDVAAVRKNRDPIKFVSAMLTENFISEAEMKDIEKEIKAQVEAEVAKAKAMSPPLPEDLFMDIYANEAGTNEYPPFIRMPNFPDSKTFA